MPAANSGPQAREEAQFTGSGRAPERERFALCDRARTARSGRSSEAADKDSTTMARLRPKRAADGSILR